MSAESRSGRRTSLFGPARVLHSAVGRVFVIKVREGSHRQHARSTNAMVCAPPKLNNRSGPPSDESIQGEGVKTGCVDTIVNDVRFFLDKYENGESDRWN